MKLILEHIVFIALAFACIYFGFTRMVKYWGKFQEYRTDKSKAAFCLGMILLSISAILCGAYLLYLEVDSYIVAYS